MPSVKCTLKSCAYLNKKGYCGRKAIFLQVTENDCNELYCLGWATPETRLFTMMMTGTIDTEEKVGETLIRKENNNDRQ